MKAAKKKRLEAHGWSVGSVRDFLGLSREEAAFVELKLALSRRLRLRRTRQHLSQQQAAGLLGSSQSRIAKMEAGDPSVSVDLLIRSLLALGATRREVAKAIGSPLG